MSVDVGPAGLVNGYGATFSQNALKMSVETLMQHQHKLSSSARDKEKASKKHDEEEGFTRSISLYWSWVRGQKAAARLGQVFGLIPQQRRNRNLCIAVFEMKESDNINSSASGTCAFHACCPVHTQVGMS